ncbi:lasso peptide biosynthesis PqqD family chaperone [Streptomyces sp. SHP 1-2]|uniref:lasso peptide biosynthesis PqqD family chaperone n=1 Tax=Streptomyces sp. SHP 1-2 TaxID=2769489 RepID=UPI0022378A07|nr:lasso peptide biosynthesis PqqD family chaperone [Streptomyces sp. SHP 1-2]MCW5252887.1 lasso peptide biosynthesis PqqD family chaperone [Streptomyces sp. SHP 1-2]
MFLHPDVVTAETEDGIVLLHQRSGRYWQLNTTGAAVIESLTSGETLNEIAHRMAERYSLPVEQVREDVEAVVHQLRAAELVESTS